jgi:hypothetical protein
MSKLRVDVINQTLRNLVVIAEGQTIQDSDTQKLDLIFDGVAAELAGLDIYYVGDPGSAGPSGGDIDDAAYLALADYLAWRGLSSFPMGADGAARITAAKSAAVSILRQLAGAPRGRRELAIDPALRTRSNVNQWPNNF